MLKIAANISLLFREVPILERFAAARKNGFDAVEIQFPYSDPAGALAGAARGSGIAVILINGPVLPTHPFGICGRPGMQNEFRNQVPQIAAYADALGVRFVHILAGTMDPSQEKERCRDVYVENLLFAAGVLADHGVEVLIEPLNSFDAPNYLLNSFPDAREILGRCEGRIGLQFDAYHAARMGLSPAAEFTLQLPFIRHVQFADAPGRHEPGTGNIPFEPLLSAVAAGRYEGWLGAEYVPTSTTEAGLAWIENWQAYSSTIGVSITPSPVISIRTTSPAKR